MNSYVYIDGWKSNICFSSAHILPDYKKCGRLHGHTYAVHVKVTGDPDEKGIIIDFSLLKDVLRQIVKELDHKILIPENNSVGNIIKYDDNVKITSFGKKYIFPIENCSLLPINSTSAENIACYIMDRLLEKFPVSNRIEEIEIGVDEGFGQGAKVTKKLEE